MATGNTFDIFVNRDKVGEAYDKNPVIITTDSQCKNLLNELKISLKLNNEEKELIDKCIVVASATDDDEVNFGPDEIISLSSLAMSNPNKSQDIIACSHYLSESIDYDGELPPNFYLKAALAYASLSDIMAKAIKAGPLVPGVVPNFELDDSDESDESDDEDFEEEISDNEEN